MKIDAKWFSPTGKQDKVEIEWHIAQRCPSATNCLFAKFITQNFLNSASYEKETLCLSCYSSHSFYGI